MDVINRERLPFLGTSHEFVGKEHGVQNSILFLTAAPNQKVSLHRHEYDEIIIVQDGRALCVVGSEEREVRTGDIVSIPAGTPHAFRNIGDTLLRQIDVHANPTFVTHWLEEKKEN
jgi:mannose-6-phosphate isomerase-like protein (cupin superfamily)